MERHSDRERIPESVRLPQAHFTGVDYISYYKRANRRLRHPYVEAEVILANDCKTILNYTKSVLCCDIHTRARTKRILTAAGAQRFTG